METEFLLQKIINGQNYYIDAQNGNDQADGRNMRSARV